MDNLLTGRRENAERHRGEARYTFVEHDICLPIPVAGAAEAVFNLASPASPIDYAKLPLETLEVGSLGTRNALELARRAGAILLHASTSEVYGDPLVHPQREDYFGNVNPVGPRACYDEAKRFAEALSTMAMRGSTDALPRWRASSTPTGRACAPTTAAWFLPSSPRPCAARTSPSSATARRREASATSTIW